MNFLPYFILVIGYCYSHPLPAENTSLEPLESQDDQVPPSPVEGDTDSPSYDGDSPNSSTFSESDMNSIIESMSKCMDEHMSGIMSKFNEETQNDMKNCLRILFDLFMMDLEESYDDDYLYDDYSSEEDEYENYNEGEDSMSGEMPEINNATGEDDTDASPETKPLEESDLTPITYTSTDSDEETETESEAEH